MKIKQFFKNNSFVVTTVLVGTVVLVVLLSLVVGRFSTTSAKLDEDVSLIPPSDTGIFGKIEVHDSGSGAKVIEVKNTFEKTTHMKLIDNPDTIWDQEQYTGTFTPISAVARKDGSMGVLTIDKIGVSANVYESTDNMEAMEKGIAHFSHSSAWDGNISLSAHNVNFDGSAGIFLNLYQLKAGDTIKYSSDLGDKSYIVTETKVISESDWSDLGHSDENKLTLITCISGEPQNRLCVVAEEVTNK